MVVSRFLYEDKFIFIEMNDTDLKKKNIDK